MKKTITTIGLIGVILFLIFGVLRHLDLPGGGVCLTLSILLLIVYAVMCTLEVVKTAANALSKAFTYHFGLSGALLAIAFLFKMMHWPGNEWVILLFFIAFAILVIVSIIRTLKETDAELKFKYANYTIWLIVGILILAYPTFKMICTSMFQC